MGFESIMLGAAGALGLSKRAARSYAFGDVSGVPTLLAHGKGERGRESINVVMLYGDEAAQSQLQSRLEADTTLEENKVKVSKVKLEDGVLVYEQSKGLTGNPSEQQFEAALKGFASAIKGAVPTLNLSCGSCSGTSSLETVVADGGLAQLCDRCANRIEEELGRSQRAYDQMSVNLPAAVGAGALLSVVMAGAWAGVTIATDRMFVLLALGIGFVVAFGVRMAAGKGGLPVQIIGGVFTLASVIMGNAMFSLYFLKEQLLLEGMEMSYADMLPFVPELLISEPSDLIFAVFAGLAGAYYAHKAGAADDLTQAIDRADGRSRMAAAS